jgi:hypothetical protein
MRQIDRHSLSLRGRSPLRRMAAALLALSTAACATAPRPAANALGHRSMLDSRQSYVLTGAVLHRRDTQTLLDLVAERWPGMVRGDLPRGAGLIVTAASPRADDDRFGVYDIRGAFLGGPEYLANVRPADVQQLRRLTQVEENARFGRRHAAGAVIVAWVRDAAS